MSNGNIISSVINSGDFSSVDQNLLFEEVKTLVCGIVKKSIQSMPYKYLTTFMEFEDIVQHVLMLVWKRKILQKFNPNYGCSFFNFLFNASLNIFKDLLKKKKLEVVLYEDWIQNLIDGDEDKYDSSRDSFFYKYVNFYEEFSEYDLKLQETFIEGILNNFSDEVLFVITDSASNEIINVTYPLIVNLLLEGYRPKELETMFGRSMDIIIRRIRFAFNEFKNLNDNMIEDYGRGC